MSGCEFLAVVHNEQGRFGRRQQNARERVMKEVLTLILAGGKGSRLEPLTRDRAKPAVPFGGTYRIIDFALSNCINSGLRRILVLTQYKAASLDRHINLGWRFLCRELDEFVDILPPQQRIDEHWYKGTADAVYQNIYTIEKYDPKYVLILSGDHIYKMDYLDLLRHHLESQADATVGCIPVPLHEADQFGVMQVDRDNRVISFREKPSDPDPLPDDPRRCLASMGIYVFGTTFLFEQLCRDATISGSANDFGKDIIPAIIGDHNVRAYPFRDKNTGRGAYWRDVGTLDAYYEANMDLVAVEPSLNLYDQTWPIRTYHPHYPPPKFVFAQAEGPNPRMGMALDSVVSPGCIISGGRVERSVLSPDVRVNSWAQVKDSILFEGVTIGRRARIQRAIIEKGVEVPEGMEIGFDRARDEARGFTVTESGVTVIGKVDHLGDHPEPARPHLAGRRVEAEPSARR
ncbi:MAG: glucose-1-phosphate adenylyltransferase [Planctomycetales bacterium]